MRGWESQLDEVAYWVDASDIEVTRLGPPVKQAQLSCTVLTYSHIFSPALYNNRACQTGRGARGAGRHVIAQRPWSL